MPTVTEVCTDGDDISKQSCPQYAVGVQQVSYTVGSILSSIIGALEPN